MAKRGIAPSNTNPTPVNTIPITTERRRLTVSATTPVGTSKRNTATSSAVPTSTSCNASRCATSTR